MYLYIYDEFLQDKKYEREMATIENRLTDLGIAGKVIRMALFREAGEQIRDEARRGASTVVVVGNDHTVSQVLDAVIDMDLPLAIIPIGPNNFLAGMLGIPLGEAACEVLSARIIEAMDAGVLNGHHFAMGIQVADARASLICEGQYRISVEPGGVIEICNLTGSTDAARDISDPSDGLLEARINVPHRSGFFKKTLGSTRLPLHFAVIDAPQEIDLLCDGELFRGSTFQISIQPLVLKVITGKERQF